LAGGLLLSTHISTSARSLNRGLPTLALNYDVGFTAWNTSLDPANTNNGGDLAVESLMHAGLLRILPNGQVAGDLASHWRVSENGRVYTFYLRKNLHFSNGDPITAQSAIWSIVRAAGPDVAPQVAVAYDGLIAGLDSYSQGKAKSISGLRALDLRTIQVTLTRRAAYFLASLAIGTNFVLDPRVERGHPVGAYMTNTCSSQVGAGPFRVACQNRSPKVTSYYPAGSTPSLSFVPNKYYYGPKPHIGIFVPVISDAFVAYQSYQTGTLDMSSVPPPEVAKWRGTKDFHQWPTGTLQFLAPNTTMAPFDNRHCRLAVAYAWDRATIADKIYGGIRKPYYGLVPPHVLAAYSDKNAQHYDLERAQAELSQCPGGIHIHMPWLTAAGADHDAERAFLDMMMKAGMGVTTSDVTSAEYFTLRTRSMHDSGIPLILAQWSQDYPDPQDYVSTLLDSHWNIGGWHNSTFSRLVHQADRLQDRAARAKLYVEAQKIAVREGALIMGFNFIGTGLVHPWIHGIVFAHTGSNIAARPVNGDWSRVSIANH
jgi:ABC-type oligopeptide transport system substrate-binding subunit